MSTVLVDKKEDIVMRLVHYFITNQNYSPIVVNGVKNEVWLENINGPYRIIRISSNYIHNDEQFNNDIYKTKSIMHQIKRKTLSFKVNTLNIFLDVNDRVNIQDSKDISSIYLSNVNDIKKNNIIVDAFPDISNNLLESTKGIDLIINVTNDINEKTAKENKNYDKVFSPKKIVVTNILIIINVLLFILTLFKPNIIYMFANNLNLVKGGEYYRIITSVFIHANIFHLLCNMYTLYIIGSQVEQFLGKKKFIFIYFASALMGSLLSLTFSSGFSVGASGAIFGLMGALVYFGYHYRLYLNTVIKSQIIPLIILNLALGFMINGIDNFAHIGGLIGGFLISKALGVNSRDKKSDKINGIILTVIYLAFLIILNFVVR